MTKESTFQQYLKVIRHFTSTRALEVIALQASPLIGIFMGGLHLELYGLIRSALLLLGSVLLTAHVFIFNDLVGHITDRQDPLKANQVYSERGIGRRQVTCLAIALLIFANIAFAAVGSGAVLFGASIALLSLLYSWSPHLGKGTPIASSINHLLGGALHFLLGYTLFHSLDARGLLISVFFGLVFAAGHLNQEVRDYKGDLFNGIRTNAVAFGCRQTFLASLFLFTVAYALLAGMAVLGLVPKFLVWTTVLWPLQVIWSRQALKRGLGFETASWMQKRYRLLFAVVGLAMIVSQLW